MKPPLIIVFLKWPEPGRVKTRLAASVGDEQAVIIYRALVRAVGLQLAQCQEEHLAICYAPAHQADSIKKWISEEAFAERDIHHWWPQPDTDLGGRQANALERAFASGYEKAALIGTDCIDLSAGSFAQAWAGLDNGADWVFGPAKDGGYYLGATKPTGLSPHSIFANVRWSTDETLSDCQQNIAAAGETFLTIETLADIDNHEDWQLVEDRLD